MKDSENWKTRDDFDRVLDAMLAKYASPEPRAGLEERILANLRAADASTGAYAWWNLRMATVLAIVLVLAASLVWRWNKTLPPTTVARRPQVNEAPLAPRVADGEMRPPPQNKVRRHKGMRTPLQPEIVAAGPKLNVFPSPLPLGEQEKILSVYVEEYPEHAALVAEARMDALRQQAEERRQITGERDEKQ